MRLLGIFIALALLFAAPLFIFGDRFDIALEGERGVAWLQGCGSWAWAAGSGLIIADLVLPIPATAVMAALGITYGLVVGGLLSGSASFIAGAIAYAATRMMGPRAAEFLVGRKDLRRATTFFERSGGYAVAMSRPLPLLPEVVACLAGLARMPARAFFLALACGSLPSGFVYAGVGALAVDRPLIALALGVIIPVLFWTIARGLLGVKQA
ncbi:MAG: VTT domain-containing protein [Phycisphaerae bacterium]|nr:VTT domain-containing protein [Phycisphaerae bacterium]